MTVKEYGEIGFSHLENVYIMLAYLFCIIKFPYSSLTPVDENDDVGQLSEELG